jgi:hypothetical protein
LPPAASREVPMPLKDSGDGKGSISAAILRVRCTKYYHMRKFDKSNMNDTMQYILFGQSSNER